MRKLRLREKPLTPIIKSGCLYSLPCLPLILQPTHFTDGDEGAKQGSQASPGTGSPYPRMGPLLPARFPGCLPGWSWGTLPNSLSKLPAFIYSVNIYQHPLGTLVALETESHSGLETGRPRTYCIISAKYDNCTSTAL